MREIKSPDDEAEGMERSDISNNNTLTELFADSVQRPQVDLVIATDVSGSMALPFGEERLRSDDSDEPSKIEWVSEALPTVFSYLGEGSRLGIVCFNNESDILCQLGETSSDEVEELQSTIMRYEVYGGADLCVGLEKAVEVLRETPDANHSKHILFVSDSLPSASPNQSPFVKRVQDVTERGIGVTFVGLDSNPSKEFSDTLSRIEGVTQHYIDSSEELLRV